MYISRFSLCESEVFTKCIIGTKWRGIIIFQYYYYKILFITYKILNLYINILKEKKWNWNSYIYVIEKGGDTLNK